MRRRDFVSLLGGATAWPFAARAQQPSGVRRIGVLMNLSDRERQLELVAFRKRLEELGWSEGRTIRIDERWAAGDLNRLHGYATELVSLKPDVIFCEGTPVVASLKQATRTVPIVFVNANDPISFGFVASMARPGGNITGFVSFEPAIGGKWLEMLREIAPNVARVALIYNPLTHTGQHFESIESVSRSLAVIPIRLPFRDAAEIERRIDDFAGEPNGGILVMPDTSTILHGDLIVRLVARHRLPAVYPFPLFVTQGGLACYGIDTREQYRQAAEYVDRIIRGAKPAELPVQLPTKFELVFNLKTAKALGLEIPPTMLGRADEVIE
jgi:putative ABC transport system substrate-binding protein